MKKARKWALSILRGQPRKPPADSLWEKPKEGPTDAPFEFSAFLAFEFFGFRVSDFGFRIFTARLG
ncbi:MAG TPA: hypothetical protein VFC78_22205 [Tepidisphaeraceae bacterium]|nr:hypothetical protein [Tepidisphaeraceae bacterium]